MTIFKGEHAKICRKSTAFDLAYNGRKLLVYLMYQCLLLYI